MDASPTWLLTFGTFVALSRFLRLNHDVALWTLELLNVVELPALEGWYVNKKLLVSTTVWFVSLFCSLTVSHVKAWRPVPSGARR